MVHFGKPEATTRVGAEFQAIIPSIMEDYKPSENMRFGLPIPVGWVRDDQPKTLTKPAIESNNAGESATVDVEKDPNPKPQDNTALIPLPGILNEPWTAIEHGGFLLGLYLFSKDFPLVKRFMETKAMGSIISYYYREFHQSGNHHRWSKWGKERCARPQYARKLFTGWSLRELISRLSFNVTEECKVRLIKDCTKYNEGRLSFPRFVFNLKQNVGMNLFVEAVAIGQGDRDLLKFREISDRSYVPLEVPIDTPRSTLTPQEILKILNGDVRLSKSKSSDLFWEAVWPRLSARGWHAVQPRNNNGLQNSRNFVFLVPGVTEFSRNELTNGIHYFDSITDVLRKVGSEPELLELESDHVEPVGSVANQDPDNDNEEYQDYLEPDVPESDRDSKMFTIVDAGVDREKDGGFKSMELATFSENTASGMNGKREETVDQRVIADLNLSRIALDSAEPTTNELEFSNAGSVVLHQPVSVPPRHSTRSRMLSTKALEALAFGYLSPKKKRKRANEEPSSGVRETTGEPVSSGGAGNVENAVDGDPFGGSTSARLGGETVSYGHVGISGI